DFGYGTPWYLGGPGNTINSESVPGSQQTWFNNDAETWQSASVQGTVYLPDQKITADIQSSMGLNTSNLITIKEMMLTPYDGNSEMAIGVQPIQGQDRIIAKQTVLIRAPTESEILSLSNSLSSSPQSGFE